MTTKHNNTTNGEIIVERILTSDAFLTKEIKKADTVTAKLPSDNNGSNNKPGNNATTSPQTGDNSNMILWIALLFISGGAVIGITVYSKKKKENAE